MSTGSDASAAVADAAEPSTPAPLPISAYGLAIVAILAGLGDWLFYGHEVIGISLVVFVLAVAAGALVVNPIRAKRKAAALAGCALAAGLLPHAVNTGVLSFLFVIAAPALFAALLFSNPGPLASDALAAARGLLFGCFWRAPVDVRSTLVGVAGKRPQSIAATLVVWFIPVTMGIVFATLFVDANPLIAGWVSAIDLKALTRRIADHLDGPRIAFWLLLIMVVWPVVFVRQYRRRASRAAKPAADTATGSSAPQLLGQAAILRSLIVFNSLFAVQTVLDALYLWGGIALPNGISYASYAHRGAYPLILTALLAAGFVIVTLKPGSETERSPLIRALVFLWIAQNVGLVISSILRLDLYVSAYSLTYWRVAAFVWMLLVAVGLVLILTRIALGRSNAWLIGANFISLALTLYVCSFANLAAIIANYNVRHSMELSGGGPSLDRWYLTNLGKQAIPALDLFVPHLESGTEGQLLQWRADQVAAHQQGAEDWRTWSYWDWQLTRYLKQAPIPAAAPPS